MDKFFKIVLNFLCFFLLLGFIGSCSVGIYKGNDNYNYLGVFLFFAMIFVGLLFGGSDEGKEGDPNA